MHQLTLPKTHQLQAQGHVGRVHWHEAPRAQDPMYWLHSRWQASEESKRRRVTCCVQVLDFVFELRKQLALFYICLIVNKNSVSWVSQSFPTSMSWWSTWKFHCVWTDLKIYISNFKTKIIKMSFPTFLGTLQIVLLMKQKLILPLLGSVCTHKLCLIENVQQQDSICLTNKINISAHVQQGGSLYSLKTETIRQQWRFMA